MLKSRNSACFSAGVPAKMSTRENVHLTILRQRILIRRQILQSNTAAKICTNREFGHPTHCILHTQCILHTVIKTCCSVLTADLTDSEGFAHFQIRICLGTKPVSCSLVFFILFSLRLSPFQRNARNFAV